MQPLTKPTSLLQDSFPLLGALHANRRLQRVRHRREGQDVHLGRRRQRHRRRPGQQREWHHRLPRGKW